MLQPLPQAAGKETLYSSISTYSDLSADTVKSEPYRYLSNLLYGTIEETVYRTAHKAGPAVFLV